MFYEESENNLYFNHFCSFYQIDGEKLSNSEDEDEFLECSHDVLPKENKALNQVMNCDEEFSLTNGVLEDLFTGKKLNERGLVILVFFYFQVSFFRFPFSGFVLKFIFKQILYFLPT